MKINSKRGYLFGVVLILLLILVGIAIDKKIVGTGYFVVENMVGDESGSDCKDCNEKNVNVSLNALSTQISALNGKIEGVEGRVGSNEAKLNEVNNQLLKNTTFITTAKAEMKKIEDEIAESK
jgi:peptidoglycan hydrolase CwlO-like protein